ncbi:dTDP-4-amino-4,6-dideoxygalactose transaminase [Dethiosulfatibacter aminovorans DSM 17477]|uniref:dTDP-4-amino-4,6-dideoxygalactose transaminase n=1 Tax=Dethiosulfatibacter aminovorans DSM 17477 TaxID=1121476 RepID=A0A1M6M6I4_9FIRM|nr:hypothetical protein [Dethiosulfatibacter aminovorans]SHJ79121.1 dTDP-4-amino-4,6-dideoxygalactose transaminase [Dethiosulfatibacter aminovorans DSM 17477]
MFEIGSEFWNESVSNRRGKSIFNMLNSVTDYLLLFSGRTAIDFALEDVAKIVTSVYVPSYCCQSMLQPFIDRNIKIEFYDVIFSSKGVQYVIDYKKQCDVFFAVSYFGFLSTTMDDVIEAFKNNGVIVIEDITHRLLSEKSYCDKADYSVASIRKWVAIPSGGLVIKHQGALAEQEVCKPPEVLIDIKVRAMTQKYEYICDMENGRLIKENQKENYLALFSEFNKGIQFEYKNLEIDEISRNLLNSIDVDTIRKKRQSNASILYESLRKYDSVKPLVNSFDLDNDCPLFFPIKVKSYLRDGLRNHLISNKIYCPVHWPYPASIGLKVESTKIYCEELSLICDQRYDNKDMKKIISSIEEYLCDKKIKNL